MTKLELKEMIRKLLTEILTEDYLRRSITEIITEKLVFEVATPQIKIGRKQEKEDIEDEGPAKIPAPQKKNGNSLVEYKSKLSTEDRKRLHQSVVSDDGDTLDKSKIAGFQSSEMRALAEDTFQHQAEKAEEEKEKTKFTQTEIDLIQPNRANAILEATEKR